jgi:nicotinamidase-related amidase
MAKIYTLSPEETVLLVIDVQRALFTRPNPVHDAYKMVDTINALVAIAQLFGTQIIYIQHSNDSILKKGTNGWQLHPDLKPASQDILIEKTHGNAFIDTTLQSELESRRIKNLIITGLVTQGCVKATALGGLKSDYQVFLVRGGHSNYNKNAVQVIEQREAEMESAGVILVDPDGIGFD